MIGTEPSLHVAIACGGTGGHLFPGLTVGHELGARGCDVSLLISPKEVDQQAVRGVAHSFNLITLPAVGLTGRNALKFADSSYQSYRAACREFAQRRPQAVLAMGGFTSAPPILAGARVGATTFLHESNTIPGRANRWLAHVVDECFVGFEDAASLLWNPQVATTGTPVRPGFTHTEAAGARLALGLHPAKPVLLVMGGSQGATGINQLLLNTLPTLLEKLPDLQVMHLTGVPDHERVRTALAPFGRRVRVQAFFSEMELLLAAATVAVSRSGASSLAEFAALRLPSVLIPYPAAVDDHQQHNADAFAAHGAARVLAQPTATPAQLVALILELAGDGPARTRALQSLADLDRPKAASDIADRILRRLELKQPGSTRRLATVLEPTRRPRTTPAAKLQLEGAAR
jgi:UDP-N-acetylglucosamine--N-acetylmuramyl-(pentapeptide) pyrophosphoryl-undecaprenol N-acetylglucosamine transferase